MSSFESVYDEIGGFGTFQVISTLIVSLCQMPVSWSMLQLSFGGSKPDFYCILHSIGSGSSNDSLSSSMSPKTDNAQSNSSGTRHWNYNTQTGKDAFYSNETLNKCTINETICEKYQFDMHSKTIIKEWGLVCDLDWVYKTMISVQMAGVLVGGMLAGQASDIVGRKKSLFSFVLLHAVTNLIGGFSPYWEMFICVRFLIGIGIGAIVVITTPYQMEFLSIKWRPILSAIPGYALGVSLFALLAFLLEDWSLLHITCSIANFLVLLGYLIVPESPRWLGTQGRVVEAEDIIKRIARINRKKVNQEQLSVIHRMHKYSESTETSHQYTYINLFKNKFTAKQSFIFFYYWFVVSTCYYGIAFGVASLPGNVYLNIFLLGVMEWPVQILTYFTNNKIGRRPSSIVFFGLSFVSLVSCLVFHEAASGTIEGIAINIFSQIAKMSVGAAWACIHIWGTELFPTVMRNLGCGFSAFGARVGGILAPYIVDLENKMSISYGILSTITLFAIIISIFVPETKGKCLNDVIDKDDDPSDDPKMDADDQSAINLTSIALNGQSTQHNCSNIVAA